MARFTLNLCELRRLSDDEDWGFRLISPSSFSLIGASIEFLLDRYRYECDAEEASTSDLDWIEAAIGALYLEMSTGMIGATMDFFGIDEAIPLGWLLCDGRTFLARELPDWYAIAPEVFKHLIVEPPTSYVSIPQSGRLVRRGTDFPSEVGTYDGVEEIYLSVDQLPPHSHSEIVVVAAPELVGAGAPLPTGSAGAPGVTGLTGGGYPIAITPYGVRCRVIICVGRIIVE